MIYYKIIYTIYYDIQVKDNTTYSTLRQLLTYYHDTILAEEGMIH